MPAEKGDPHNLTETPGVHESWPAWSPDGRSVAYFSDEGGEYQLHVRSAEQAQDQAKVYPVAGRGLLRGSDLVAGQQEDRLIVDNSQSLFWLDLGSGQAKKIASEPQYGPSALRTLHAAWSPDSRWIAYCLGNKAAYHRVYAYELALPTVPGRSPTAWATPSTRCSTPAASTCTSSPPPMPGPVNQWFRPVQCRHARTQAARSTWRS